MGVAAGNWLSGVFAFLAGIELARVNGIVAILIWIMIYPMMVKVDFASLRHIGDRPKGLVITVIVDWLIKPFTMAGLGALFFGVLFRDQIHESDARQYIAGMILLGSAPCTAMVFVWSQLTRGDAAYTLVRVALNDLIMVFAFAPIVALLFAFQGPRIVEQPILIALIAAPLLVQSTSIFALGYGRAWLWKVPHEIAAPAALIGASNFFERRRRPLRPRERRRAGHGGRRPGRGARHAGAGGTGESNSGPLLRDRRTRPLRPASGASRPRRCWWLRGVAATVRPC